MLQHFQKIVNWCRTVDRFFSLNSAVFDPFSAKNLQIIDLLWSKSHICWSLRGGGFQDRFWPVFPMFQKTRFLKSVPQLGQNHYLNAQKTKIVFVRLEISLSNRWNLKTPGFCDAHKRRVRENVAHFMSKKSPAAQKLNKPGKWNGKIRHLGWIKTYFTIFWSSSCSKKTRFLTKPGLETPPSWWLFEHK